MFLICAISALNTAVLIMATMGKFTMPSFENLEHKQ